VDVDHVLRKEVNMDCITPSHPNPIPHGTSLDIYQLLALPDAILDPQAYPGQQRVKWRYQARKPALERSQPDFAYLDAQISRAERKVSTTRSRSTRR
jgi:DNA polymerase gamma 1